MANTISISGKVFGEVKYKVFENGKQVANFKLSEYTGKDTEGNYKLSRLYECSIWGKRGEYFADNVKDGMQLVVFGTIIDMKVWHSGEKEGVNCSVMVSDFDVMRGGKEENGGEKSSSNSTKQKETVAAVKEEVDF